MSTYSRAATSEDYLAELQPDQLVTVQTITTLIQAKFPEAEAKMSWGMLVFWVNGKDIVGIAARKTAFTLYVPFSDVVDSYSPRLGKVNCGKGCVRFKNLADLDLQIFDELLDALGSKVPAP